MEIPSVLQKKTNFWMKQIYIFQILLCKLFIYISS